MRFLSANQFSSVCKCKSTNFFGTGKIYICNWLKIQKEPPAGQPCNRWSQFLVNQCFPRFNIEAKRVSSCRLSQTATIYILLDNIEYPAVLGVQHSEWRVVGIGGANIGVVGNYALCLAEAGNDLFRCPASEIFADFEDNSSEVVARLAAPPDAAAHAMESR